MASRYLFAMSFARTFVNQQHTEYPMIPVPTETRRRRPQTTSHVDQDAKLTFLDWAIILIWHEVLLFPFPGCILLYSLHDGVSTSVLFVGTLFGLWSISAGVPLLANARQYARPPCGENRDPSSSSGNHGNTWIFYSTLITFISSTGLLAITGMSLVMFLPVFVFPIILSTPSCCHGYRKLVTTTTGDRGRRRQELQGPINENGTTHNLNNSTHVPTRPLSSSSQIDLDLVTPTSPSSASIVVIALFPAADMDDGVRMEEEEDPPTYENFEPPSYEESVQNRNDRSDNFSKVPE